MKLFTPKTPEQLAQSELLDAQRQLLQAQSASEEWASVVQFNNKRIARLRNYLLVQPTPNPKVAK
jgi:hypothetical protein